MFLGVVRNGTVGHESGQCGSCDNFVIFRQLFKSGAFGLQYVLVIGFGLVVGIITKGET
jgi:hypothetical protein